MEAYEAIKRHLREASDHVDAKRFTEAHECVLSAVKRGATANDLEHLLGRDAVRALRRWKGRQR